MFIIVTLVMSFLLKSTTYGQKVYFLGSNAVLLVALIAASIDYRVWMRRLKLGKDATVYDTIATSKGWTIAKPVLMVVFLLVSFAFLVGDSYNPFLYFRF